MTLVHYSAAPFVFEPAYVYPPTDHFKPRGLWVSVETDDDDDTWRAWCESEGFHLEALAHQAVIELVPAANVRHLATALEVQRFSREFRASNPLTDLHAIDWPRVQRTYGGLIIAPYQWSCRLDLDCFWYYGWDCASACLWDLTQIESVLAL